MRKVTQTVVRAFLNRQRKAVGNTSTDGVRLFLHGNEIARRVDDRTIAIRDGGWQSSTTKERLNGLPGVSVSQRNFHWYLNGEPWDGTEHLIDVGPGVLK